MKRTLSIMAIGILSVGAAAAQNAASGRASGSAQAQGSMQASKSGAQTSANESSASSASANSKNSAVNLSNGTRIDATLMNSLDAKRNKPGDRVEARTTQDVKQDGKVVLKRGTLLVGHVTQTQARAKGQTQSQLGVAFDRAIPRKGQELPMNATIQALAISQSSAMANAASDNMMASDAAMGGMSGGMHGGGGLMSGVASTAGASTGAILNTATPMSSGASGTLNGAVRSTGAVGGLTSGGELTSASSGVFGLEGLSIASEASNATQGSMIVSNTKNVRLESGTQMVLSAAGQVK